MRKIFILVAIASFFSACQSHHLDTTGSIQDPTYITSDRYQFYKHCIDQSKVDPEAMCTEQYEPVCGCDRKTYPNSCYAEKAGVTAYEKGACQEEAHGTH